MTAPTAALRSSLAYALSWAESLSLPVSSVTGDIRGRVELYLFDADAVAVHDACTGDGWRMLRSAHEGSGLVTYERGDRYRDPSSWLAVTARSADALAWHR